MMDSQGMLNSFGLVYTPLQPAVGETNTGVLYSESPPDPRLAKYVYCYWRLQTTSRLSQPFAYRVVPDGCIDIVCNVHDFDEPKIMGFARSFTVFDIDCCFYYVGVRFLPAAFPMLFHVDASTLTDRYEDLFNVVPSLAVELSQQIDGGKDFQKIKQVFDNVLYNRLKLNHRAEDKRLYNALAIVLRAHGNVNLKLDVDTGISPRQLRRLFQFYLGDTPKAFSKVVRFQYFLQLLSSPDRHEHNKMFLDAGYYDQPHFNKQFKELFGLTPGEALSR
jgi:AraC-like DNA-binding protein